MRPLIGRTTELARLRRAAEEAPQLVVIRGRRRVGKSFLVNHAYADSERFIYFQADEGGERLHLDLLSAECARLSGAPVAFADWNVALEYVRRLAQDAPLVLALDEFQWMWLAQDALPSILMRHFDAWQRDGVRVCLVIAGSELTMMEGLVEGDRPLFGRAAARPLIEPFDFRLAAEFGPADASAEDKLRRYAILGGTPQYQVWAGRGDVESVLKERILPPGESLSEEPLQLLRGERGLRDPGAYYEVLQAIAQGRTQFNEIAQATGSSATNALAARLTRLEELGYIEHRVPVAGNGTRSYGLKDPYFRFWFRFVSPNRSRLQGGRVDEVYDDIVRGLDDFMGASFEAACRRWARTYAPKDSVFATAPEIGAYWNRTHSVEVDLVAMAKRRVLALGACKWSATADGHVHDQLIAHRDAIAGGGTPQLFVFARGFHRTLQRRASAGEVTLVSARDLYA